MLLAAWTTHETLQGKTDQPKSRGERKRGREPRLSKVDPDTCFFCGEKGHWKTIALAIRQRLE